jgi:hypothetical protein
VAGSLRPDARAVTGDLWRAFAELLAFVVPIAAAVGLLLAQNAARFGAPLDFGYRAMAVSGILADDLERYGQFNTHFLARNVDAMLFNRPVLVPADLRQWAGLLAEPARLVAALAQRAPARGFAFPLRFDPWGSGLWMVTPALVFALRVPRRRETALFVAAWLGSLAVAVPDLLYYNTGWYQYGYRFALDFLPLLLVPMAMGLRRPLRRAWRGAFLVLLGASILSNLLGARWFMELAPF